MHMWDTAGASFGSRWSTEHLNVHTCFTNCTEVCMAALFLADRWWKQQQDFPSQKRPSCPITNQTGSGVGHRQFSGLQVGGPNRSLLMGIVFLCASCHLSAEDGSATQMNHKQKKQPTTNFSAACGLWKRHLNAGPFFMIMVAVQSSVLNKLPSKCTEQAGPRKRVTKRVTKWTFKVHCLRAQS